MDIITDIDSVEDNLEEEEDGVSFRGRRPFRERRISGTGSFKSSNFRSTRRLSRSESRPEKERMAKIERENHILLQKILDCHLGLDRKRTSHIPRHVTRGSISGNVSRRSTSGSPVKRTSNQINGSESKRKTDFENLLLLKKILGAKPSKYVRESFS